MNLNYDLLETTRNLHAPTCTHAAHTRYIAAVLVIFCQILSLVSVHQRSWLFHINTCARPLGVPAETGIIF